MADDRLSLEVSKIRAPRQPYGMRVCLAILLGAWCGSHSALANPFWWLGWTLISVLALGVCLIAPAHKPQARWSSVRMGVLCSSFLLGGLYFTWVEFTPGPQDVSQHLTRSRWVYLTGVVHERWTKPGQWVMRVQQVNGQARTGRILIFTTPAVNHGLAVGSQVRMEGMLDLPWRARWQGDFDYRAYLRHHQITALLKAKNVGITNRNPSTWRDVIFRWADEARQQITHQFALRLPQPLAPLLSSMVLGDRAVGLDETLADQFRRSGLVHLLAASGLNVGMVGGSILLLSGWLRLSQRLGIVLAAIAVLGYALMTGLPPSVQRAGAMFEGALLLKAIRKQWSPATVLCLSAVGLLLLNPMIVTMIGFYLSFLSTLGLLLMVPLVQHELGFYITRGLAGLIAVPLVAQLWVTPVLWYYFHQVGLVAVLANILALPLAAWISTLGFFMGAWVLVFHTLPAWMASMVHYPLAGLHALAQGFAQWPMAVWQAPPISAYSALLSVLLLLLLGGCMGCWNRHSRLRWSGLVVLLMLTPLSLVYWQQAHNHQIAWLSHRDGTLSQWIRTKEGVVIVTTPRLSMTQARDLVTYSRQEGQPVWDRLIVLAMSPQAVHIKSPSGLTYVRQHIQVKALQTPWTAPAIRTARQRQSILRPLAPTEQWQTPSTFARLYTASTHEDHMEWLALGNARLLSHWSSALEGIMAGVNQQPLLQVDAANYRLIDYHDGAKHTVALSPETAVTRLRVSEHAVQLERR